MEYYCPDRLSDDNDSNEIALLFSMLENYLHGLPGITIVLILFLNIFYCIFY